MFDARPLEDAFTALLREQRAGGAAFAATVDGQLVVNLFGGDASPRRPWQADTQTLTMSVTKGWAALGVQLLVDRGELDLDARVARYWPDFAANGKGDTIVRQLLLHQSGVIGVPNSSSLLGWDGSGWEDLDAIAEALASARPAWRPGSAHGYHAVTWGWLLGELVRRVSGVTLGLFFAKELAEPLGIASAIGVEGEQRERLAEVVRRNDPTPYPLRGVMRKLTAAMRDPGTLLGQAFLADGERCIMDAEELVSSDGFLAAEVPSSNGVSSAADLARMFSLLACGGSVDGRQILSEASVAQWSALALAANDDILARSVPGLYGAVLARRSRALRTLGYTANSGRGDKARFGPTPSAFGVQGAGGQVAFADPVRRVSVGFVRSELSDSADGFNRLVATLYRQLNLTRP